MSKVLFWFTVAAVLLIAASIGNHFDRERCYRNGGTHFGWDCTDDTGKTITYTKD